jgi:NAD(P)-dependent dehydrogenase (short-subunit alcohol dehydrogenase family)
MKGAGRGAIVNLCSLTVGVGIPTATPYGSSKTGTARHDAGTGAEWAPLDIRVNAIAPGYFRTAMTEGFYADRRGANDAGEKSRPGASASWTISSGSQVFSVPTLRLM